MNYVKINGISFDVSVSISDYEENFNVLDGDAAGRVRSGRMIRDVIGAYFGHNITFFNNGDDQAFDELWEYIKLHSVDDSVYLEAVDGQKQISYDAYYTSGKRKLVYADRQKNVNHWDELSINFIPIKPQLRP